MAQCAGNALEFDGDDDYVLVPEAFDTPQGTFECWVVFLEDGFEVRWLGHVYPWQIQGTRALIFTELELPFRDAFLDAMQKRGAIDEERTSLVRSIVQPSA